jgi:hypothetical protein
MASSYTDLGIEKMATGENAGTWGTKTNTNLDIIEKSIAGYVEQAVTSGGTTALSITDGDATESTSVARHAVIKLTGTITGNSIVTVPDSVEKVYIVTNGTSGAYTVQFKTASGTGITFGVSEKTTRLVYSDGTNLVDSGFSGASDMEGRELVLDADGDTSLTADTDDQIDIKVGGTDRATITTGAIAPSSSDGISLGTSALEFSDLFLADGAVVNFGDDQEIKLTHVADTGLTLKHTATADDKPVSLTLQTGETDIAANDIIGKIDFQAPDEGTGTDAILVAAGIEAVSEGDFSSSSNATKLSFKTGASEAASEKMSLSSGGNLTISGDLTVSGDDITMGTNTSGNLLIADGTNFNSIAVGDLSAISTVAADDVLMAVDTSGGGLKKITRSALVSGLAAGTMSNIVEDTSPQLGGDLDTNSANILIDDAHFIGDENGNEQIIFQTTSSAVNQFDVTNAATGNPPSIKATGGDSNIDFNISAKGTGHVTVLGDTNSGAIQFNCENNSHGQIVIAQPHSASVTNTLTLPAGSSSTLVSLVSTDTLTNKTLTTPKIAEIDSLSSGDITLDAEADIVLDAAGGNIEFKDAGTTQLTLDMDGTAGAQVISLAVDSDDLIFKQYDGTTVLTLDDDTTVKVATDLTVGDDLTLLSDSAVLGFGADTDTTLTHTDGTGLTLNSTNKLCFQDTGTYVGSNADGDLDVVSDGTAVDSINLESAGGITLDAGTAGSGVIYEDDGTEMLRIHNSSSDVIVEAKVQDKDILFKGDDGGSGVTSLTLDMSNAGAAIFGAAAYNAEATLTDGSTPSWNAITQPVAKITIAGNRTIGAASGGVAGAFISLLIIQDGTGSRTMTWNAAYEFASDTAPTLTTTANKGDLFVFRYNGSKWLEVGRNLALTLS